MSRGNHTQSGGGGARISHPPATSRVERVLYGEGVPEVSIVIPTRDGGRDGLLGTLLDDLHDQTLHPFEVLLVIGDSRQGRAINRGARAAQGRIIVTMDDDTGIGTPELLRRLSMTLDEHPDVGMVGASTVLPLNASGFQRAASRQIPRRLFPVVDRITDSDMVHHPCLAMRRAQFLGLGGEDEDLIRGLDPILRHKVRGAGMRVVVVPHATISHPLPERLGALLRLYFRNGRGSAFGQRHYPERILTLGHGFEGDRFEARTSRIRRWGRFPLRLATSFVSGRWIRLGVDVAYAFGYAREWFAGGEGPRRRSDDAGPSRSEGDPEDPLPPPESVC